MKNAPSIVFAFILFMISCKAKEPESTTQLPVGVSTQEPEADTVSQRSKELQAFLDKLEYYVFGIYCGECSGECATMYKYTMRGNANMLLADHTDSFFRSRKKEVNCGTSVDDTGKNVLAGTVMDKIPLELLRAEKDKVYGCPDCMDGCGVYFEWGSEDRMHKFYLDPHDKTLDPAIMDFIQYLEETVYKLKQ